MNKSKELISKLRLEEEREKENHIKSLYKIFTPLNNQVFFNIEPLYQNIIDDNPNIRITINKITANSQEYNFIGDSIQISFDSSKTQSNQDSVKIIKAKNVRVYYSNKIVHPGNVLDFLGEDAYLNEHISSFNNVEQIILDAFDKSPQERSKDNWVSFNKIESKHLLLNKPTELLIHKSLIYKQIIPQIMEQIEDIRKNPHVCEDFNMLEKNIHHYFLDENLTNSKSKIKKAKI